MKGARGMVMLRVVGACEPPMVNHEKSAANPCVGACWAELPVDSLVPPLGLGRRSDLPAIRQPTRAGPISRGPPGPAQLNAAGRRGVVPEMGPTSTGPGPSSH